MASAFSLKEAFDYTSKALMGILVFFAMQIWQDTSAMTKQLPLIELRLERLEKWQAETAEWLRQGREDRKQIEADIEKQIALIDARVDSIEGNLKNK
jgi:hypothetical protein